MGDVLSKEEIEALLSAVSEGKIPHSGKKKKPSFRKATISYNFKRPALISKDQIRVLEFLHEDFTRSLGVKLSGHLRTTVEVEIVATEQLTYTEFIVSLSEPTYIVVVDVSPLSGQIIFEFNPLLVFFIVDRLLGGSGKSSQEARELTSVERAIMDRILSLTLESFKEVYAHIVPLKTSVRAKESNPQFVQIASGNDLVISCIFKVGMGQNYGTMTICYPVSTIRPILPRLSSKRWISEKEEEGEGESSQILQKKLLEAKVDVTVELGKAEVTVLEFLRLAPGDVVRLNQPVNRDLLVKIQGFPKFYAIPGKVGRRRAVQITSIIRKED